MSLARANVIAMAAARQDGDTFRGDSSDLGVNRRVLGLVGLLLLSAALVGLVVTRHDDTAADRVESSHLDATDGPTANEPPQAPPEETPPSEAVGSSSGTDPSPQPRDGLLHSAEEVEIWQERAQKGPYRVAGDAGPNSPGDWTRILENTEIFIADSTASRWTGPSQGDLSTCVLTGSDEPPVDEPGYLRDAAFVYLLTGGTTERDLVKQELIWQSSEPATDFSNRQRWCTGVMWDINPSFATASWLTKLVLAYDYLGTESFTARERAQIEGWFLEAARFFRVDLDTAMEQSFANRGSSDELNPSLIESPECDRVHFLDGPVSCLIHKKYNNRHASNARFVGLVGILTNDHPLKRSARLFVEEYVKYGVFPEGFVSDFERWRDDFPDLGWAYGAMTVGPVLVIADAFARSGDTSLYDLETSVGAFGSEGGPKSLLTAAQSFGRYVDGTYERYGTDDPANRGDSEFLINGSHRAAGWYGVHDIVVANANVYYQDTDIRSAYTRSAPAMAGYPADPAGGPFVIWNGESGIFPGMLFMYGQMEGEVWPF